MIVATIDPAVSAAVGVLLSGGTLAAWNAYRKTPFEAESISVMTMRGVIEELRDELDRKDRQLFEQNRVIGELRTRIERLEDGASAGNH